MTATTNFYCKSEFLQIFNFTILCYSRNSRKLDACKKLVFYSILNHLTTSLCSKTFSASNVQFTSFVTAQDWLRII